MENFKMSYLDWAQTLSVVLLFLLNFMLVRDTLEMDRRTRKIRAVISAVCAALNITLVTEETENEKTLH